MGKREGARKGKKKRVADSKRRKEEERRGRNNAGVKTRRNLRGGKTEAASWPAHRHLSFPPLFPASPPRLLILFLHHLLRTSRSSCAAPVFSLTGAKARVGRARRVGAATTGAYEERGCSVATRSALCTQQHSGDNSGRRVTGWTGVR